MPFIILPPASTAASYSVHIIHLHSVSTLSSSPAVCLGPRPHSQDFWNNSASPFSVALHVRAGPRQQTPGSLVAHIGQHRCHVQQGQSMAGTRAFAFQTSLVSVLSPWSCRKWTTPCPSHLHLGSERGSGKALHRLGGRRSNMLSASRFPFAFEDPEVARHDASRRPRVLVSFDATEHW